MELQYALPDGDASVRVDPTESGYTITILRSGQGPAVYRVEALGLKHGRLTLQIGTRRLHAHVARQGNTSYVALAGKNWRFDPPRPRGRRGDAAGGSLTAAMPGKVLDVLVQIGQPVAAGAALVILEAMKMELRVAAPAEGIVTQIYVQPGDVVDQGQKLVELGLPA